MDSQDFVATVIILSLLTGVVVSPAVDFSGTLENLRDDMEKFSSQLFSTGEAKKDLEVTHGHAMFFLYLDEEKDLTGEKFQLRSRYVHMENNRPHIVHKHVENITWSYFLETMDIEVGFEENQICVSFEDERNCGNGSVLLNGEEIRDLDREIQQDDNFAIILPRDEGIREGYMEEVLPQDYRPGSGSSI